ncbi:MAG: metallophosphoesterase [Vulcanococcus sp.]
MTSFQRRPHHWVIGDVHGCADALEQLLLRLPAGDRLIFCGDAINRGPAIEASMERIWGLVESGRAVWLRGNHEQDLISGLQHGDWQAERRLAGCDTFRQLGEERCSQWFEHRRAIEAVVVDGIGHRPGQLPQRLIKALRTGATLLKPVLQGLGCRLLEQLR